MPVRAAHCEACAPSRRAVDHVVDGQKIARVEACECKCRSCTALAVLYRHRPRPASDHEPYFGVRVRHPITSARIRISASSQRELDDVVRAFETLRADYRTGARSTEAIMQALKRLTRGTITLERAAVEYMERSGLKKNTLRRTASFLNGLSPELRARELDTLDKGTVTEWLGTLTAAGKREGTIRLAWWTLSAIVAHAVERGQLEGVPWGAAWQPKIRGRARREREALRSPEELMQLLIAAAELDDAKEARGDLGQLQPKIATATVAGLRQEELAGLLWTDFDREACTVRIARQGDGSATKTRRIDVLAVVPELFDLLDAHAERLKHHKLYRKTGPVFPGPESTRGKPRLADPEVDTRQGIGIKNDELRRAVKRAGLPSPKSWSAHSLKDSFATLEGATHGSDLRALQARTRHASLDSLFRYLRTRSRATVPPGFRLPPIALLRALPAAGAVVPELYEANGARRDESRASTAQRDESPQTATSHADGAARLEGGRPGPTAFTDGPSPVPDPAAQGTLQEIATLGRSVNVATSPPLKDVSPVDAEDASIVGTIASLMEPLTARPELVSERRGDNTRAPRAGVTTKGETRRGPGSRKDTSDAESDKRERSASLPGRTERRRAR